MMTDKNDNLITFIFCCLCAGSITLIGVVAAVQITEARWIKAAIDHGAARYEVEKYGGTKFVWNNPTEKE